MQHPLPSSGSGTAPLWVAVIADRPWGLQRMSIGSGNFGLGRINGRPALECIFESLRALAQQAGITLRIILPYGHGLDVRHPGLAPRDLWLHLTIPCSTGWYRANRANDAEEKEMLETAARRHGVEVLPHAEEGFLGQWSQQNLGATDRVLYLSSGQVGLNVDLTLELLRLFGAGGVVSAGVRGHRVGLTPLVFSRDAWLEALARWQETPFKDFPLPETLFPLDPYLEVMETGKAFVRFDTGYDIRTPFLLRENPGINRQKPADIVRQYIALGTNRTYTGASGQAYTIHFSDRMQSYGWNSANPPRAFGDLWRTYQAEENLIRQLAGMEVAGKDVLEIGCGDGVKALFFKRAGARRVYATDFEPGLGSPGQRQFLAVWPEGEMIPAAVDTTGTLPKFQVPGFLFAATAGEHLPFSDSVFDLIYSDQVLEHVRDPQACLREMARVTRPGGVILLRYNPFFHLIGGHGSCNTDIPWGHVAMTAEEMEEYVGAVEFPQRGADARRSLDTYFTPQRMYLADFERYLEGLMPIQVLFNHLTESTGHREALTPEFLERCRKNYPRLTVRDLCSGEVTVLLRKLPPA